MIEKCQIVRRKCLYIYIYIHGNGIVLSQQQMCHPEHYMHLAVKVNET